jgi:alkanesulfonate monooxygenase SsuD/methylene tetrahydromethanopterin reductase-like flavin-dependent oxidoreductase (luciferase family)
LNQSGFVDFNEVRLYTRPAKPPLILGAAVTPETAARVPSWADGMITVGQPQEKLAEVVKAFRGNGGEGKPMYLQAQVSFADTYEQALEGAWDQWRMSVLPSDQLVDAVTPEQIDRMSEKVRPEEVAERVRVSAEIDEHVAWLESDRDLGFDAVYVHNVNRDQSTFIHRFGSEVLPALRGVRMSRP